MTYERPKVLLSTLKAIESQTFPPSYILVVDNSESRETEKLISELPGEHIGYLRVGYNSGPAGAARKGLEQLSQMGFQWIYWGDDDDPPANFKIFESLFENIQRIKGNDNIGAFGCKGGKLNRIGRINSFSNTELKKQDFIDVDMIPGGGNLLINAEVVRRGTLPREELFFGFEELEFCLQVKKQGYRVVISTKEWLDENYDKGYVADDYKWKDSFLGRKDLLWRSYYSTRNLLFIFLKNGYFLAFTILVFKAMVKSLYGYLYGVEYGFRNCKLQWLALWHLLIGKLGVASVRRNPLFSR